MDKRLRPGPQGRTGQRGPRPQQEGVMHQAQMHTTPQCTWRTGERLSLEVRQGR